MRKINKGHEPSEWTEYRLTKGIAFSGIPALRKSLLVEQGYICAYCMQRISMKSSQIEHILPQEFCKSNEQKDKIFDYNNLVICCKGSSFGEQHCDVKKSNQLISFNLFDDAFINTLSYSSMNGTLRCSNQTHQQEIDDVLNLNFPMLKRMRVETLNGVVNKLGKGSWRAKDIRRMIDKWDSMDANGMFKPFNGIVIWYLNKRLQRAERQ